MVLILHIAIALSSLALTAYALIRPTQRKLYGSYGLTASTLATGTYLVATRPAHLAEACSVGLVYLGVMFAGIIAARHRLGRVHGA